MYKNDFPLLMQDSKIHYLDSAATSQRPKLVIDAISDYFHKHNGNAGRGGHSLAIDSSQVIEDARESVKKFIGSQSTDNIVFTKNCTESLNIIAYCYALPKLQPNDEILIGVSNHHANLVPWQYVSQKTGAKVKYVYLNDDGTLDLNDFKSKLNNHTKIVSVSSVVNTTGVINSVKAIINFSHEQNAVVVIDACQSITHFEQNVTEMDCDFLTFSGHKMFSDFGVGVLYGKYDLLENMPPLLYGGDMVNFVTEESSDYKNAPHKFEGGTLNVSAIYSLKIAIDYINSIGYDNISKVISTIDDYAIKELAKLDFVETYNTNAKQRAGIIAFNVKDVHSHDTSFILNDFGVMVRSGHHCTQPLMNYLNINSACRASFGIYNTKEDIDTLVIALKKVHQIFSMH